MEEVKLIGSSPSLFCTRVEWALRLKGVKYEYIKEDLRNKSDLLLKSNPVYKKVPVLLINHNSIAESLIILEYIDDSWKHYPLLPQDPFERAQARFWAKFADDKCLMGTWTACMAEGEEKMRAIESVQESFAFIEKQIEGKKFFGGEEIGFLDLGIGWICLWLNVMEEVGGMKLLDPEKFPCLHNWAQNFIKIPVIHQFLPPRDDLLNYFKASLNYIQSLAAGKP
nr:probable glutathione S-transferase [Ipomoea batatas]GME07145.1 probable glutathione S-transferase [Ipomoea batatas]